MRAVPRQLEPIDGGDFAERRLDAVAPGAIPRRSATGSRGRSAVLGANTTRMRCAAHHAAGTTSESAGRARVGAGSDGSEIIDGRIPPLAIDSSADSLTHQQRVYLA